MATTLTQLYPIEEAPSLEPPTVEVHRLVHGLDGHPIRSWQADDANRTVWPRDLLPTYLPKVRVLSFGYNATIRGSTSRAKIRDHARSLLQWLIDKREDDNAKMRPLVFVGHSLGGVIIKQPERFESIDASTSGIMFFATPHYALDANDLEELVSHIVTRHGHEGATTPTNNMLMEIRRNRQVLTNVTDDFRSLLKRRPFGIVNFLEGDMTEVLGQVVVDKVKRHLLADEEDYMHLNGDHLGICKFTREQVDEFRAVWKRLQRLIEKSPRAQSINNKLWIYGDPVCGKTYLATHIISVIRAAIKTELVLQCFLSAGHEERGDCRAILRSTLHQVAKSRLNVIDQFLLIPYEGRQSEQLTWDTDTLRDLWPNVIAHVINGGSSVTIILDGFDEIGDGDQSRFLRCFKQCEELSQQSGGRLRLLILSRRCKCFYDNLKKGDFATYEMGAKDTLDDIHATVSEKLNNFASHVDWTPEFLETVCIRITRNARGMYLWAAVMVADLQNRLPTEYDMKKQLKEGLPRELAELYDSILGRISTVNRDNGPIVKMVLRWVTFRQEVLKAEELGIGLALTLRRIRAKGDPAAAVINDRYLSSFKLPSAKPAIYRLCGQLLRFSKGDNVQLVHRSLMHYLTTPPPVFKREHPDWKIIHHCNFCLDPGESHAILASLCMAYLTISYFGDSGEKFQQTKVGREEWVRKVRGRMKMYVFVRYAALCWSKHLKEAGPTSAPSPDKEQDRLAQAKLEDSTTHYSVCWSEVWWLLRRWPRLDFPSEPPIVDIMMGGQNSEHSTLKAENSELPVQIDQLAQENWNLKQENSKLQVQLNQLTQKNCIPKPKNWVFSLIPERLYSNKQHYGLFTLALPDSEQEGDLKHNDPTLE
ncbi:protein SERAC1 [Diplogelasinospora grovesii]|uniref:Protein SERAC1 n=1 Tax=Diplogelasinospora grovesii TaxID=303347 RepID=A0AAN6N8S9_9PEZI|nr:protein SERAC1 [Diplogelasinospora grovesii]